MVYACKYTIKNWKHIIIVCKKRKKVVSLYNEERATGSENGSLSPFFGPLLLEGWIGVI